MLAIASAGDNVFNMLLAEPTTIHAVDVNPAQTALVELKLAAIKLLAHNDFLVLLGYATCPDVAQRRSELCAQLDLSPECRDYWEENEELLQGGIAMSGRLVCHGATHKQPHAHNHPDGRGHPDDLIPPKFVMLHAGDLPA